AHHARRTDDQGAIRNPAAACRLTEHMNRQSAVGNPSAGSKKTRPTYVGRVLSDPPTGIGVLLFTTAPLAQSRRVVCVSATKYVAYDFLLYTSVRVWPPAGMAAVPGRVMVTVNMAPSRL